MTTEMSDLSAPDIHESSADGTRWFQSVPEDWAGWLAFQAQVTASPRARASLRDWMSKHLDEERDGLRLGLGLFAAGARRRALPLLENCSEDLARLLTALALRDTRRASEAAERLTALTNSPRCGLAARLALVELYVQIRDLQALEREVQGLADAGASAADRVYAEGLLARARGDYEDAAQAWRAALAADPDHAGATFRLAELLDLQGQEDEALQLYDRFRSGSLPAHVGALMNLGTLYEDKEEHAWAATCFRLVTEADPEDTRARRYLADAEASLDQFYDESRERKVDKQNAVLRIPVTDFELSVRARNCLQRMNIHTLGDLVCRSESELLSFKNFGETSLQEVKDILQMKGLRLGMMSGLEGMSTPLAAASPQEAAPDGDVTAIKISELDLSVRSRAALATLGITNVGELAQTNETTLLSCKNFGQTSLEEIRSKLRGLGLDLAG